MSSISTSLQANLLLAPSPFDDPEADIVLRTSDNVLFRVYRTILCLSSPFFQTMFTLPQQPLNSTDDQSTSQIAVSEDSNTWRIVLLFCYPGAYPAFKDISEVKLVINMLTKYDMLELADYRVKPFLEPFIAEEPMKIFAVAYHHKWKALAEDAARALLRHPWNDDYVEELELITAGTYNRVRVYHKRCCEAARNVALNLAWINANDSSELSRTWFTCRKCSKAPERSGLHLSDGSQHSVRDWFANYLAVVGFLLFEKCLGGVDKLFETFCVITSPTICGDCRSSAFKNIAEFSAGSFASQIKKVVSEVHLDVGL